MDENCNYGFQKYPVPNTDQIGQAGGGNSPKKLG